MAYTRPVLCRLCGFPAPDGGVQVSEVDRGKLSEWCLRMMDTELDQEGLEKAVFCQFCMWDSRFIQQHSTGTNKGETLKSQIGDKVETYIIAGVIQRCAVQISPFPAKKETEVLVPLHKNSENEDAAIRKRCTYCSKSFDTKLDRNGHVSQTHKDIQTFRCSLCFNFFKNKEDKHTHMIKTHKDKLTCFYCSITFENYDQKLSHLVQNHKDVSSQFKCSKNCNNLYFWTKTELETHLKIVHRNTRKLRKCFYCCELVVAMGAHIRKKHKAESIKCNFHQNCTAYFHTEEEMKKHVQKSHRNAKRLCPFCKEMFGKNHFADHIQRMHSSNALRCNFSQACKKYFCSEEDRKVHILEAHTLKQEVVDVSGSCIYCNEMISWDQIETHTEEMHSSEAIRCDFTEVCLTYFHSEEERQKHGEEVHGLRKVTALPKDGFRTYMRNTHL